MRRNLGRFGKSGHNQFLFMRIGCHVACDINAWLIGGPCGGVSANSPIVCLESSLANGTQIIFQPKKGQQKVRINMPYDVVFVLDRHSVQHAMGTMHVMQGAK